MPGAWPAEATFRYGDPVEKFTGEARWEGVVVSAYRTTAGKLRYVVEVKPQGFQMIAVPSQLRARRSGARLMEIKNLQDRDTELERGSLANKEGDKGQ